MANAARQLELLPIRKRTAAQRREWIRQRLEGLEYRQAARAERRRLNLERRHSRETGPTDDRQVTIAELLGDAEFRKA